MKLEPIIQNRPPVDSLLLLLLLGACRYVDRMLAYYYEDPGCYAALDPDALKSATSHTHDIYLTALAAVEMCLGRLPEQLIPGSHQSIEDYLEAVWSYDWQISPELAALPEGLRSWLRRALAADPACRFQSASQALEHPWLRGEKLRVQAAVEAAEESWAQMMIGLKQDIAAASSSSRRHLSSRFSRRFRVGSSSSRKIGSSSSSSCTSDCSQQDTKPPCSETAPSPAVSCTAAQSVGIPCCSTPSIQESLGGLDSDSSCSAGENRPAACCLVATSLLSGFSISRSIDSCCSGNGASSAAVPWEHCSGCYAAGDVRPATASIGTQTSPTAGRSLALVEDEGDQPVMGPEPPGTASPTTWHDMANTGVRVSADGLQQECQTMRCCWCGVQQQHDASCPTAAAAEQVWDSQQQCEFSSSFQNSHTHQQHSTPCPNAAGAPQMCVSMQQHKTSCLSCKQQQQTSLCLLSAANCLQAQGGSSLNSSSSNNLSTSSQSSFKQRLRGSLKLACGVAACVLAGLQHCAHR